MLLSILHQEPIKWPIVADLNINGQCCNNVATFTDRRSHTHTHTHPHTHTGTPTDKRTLIHKKTHQNHVILYLPHYTHSQAHKHTPIHTSMHDYEIHQHRSPNTA